MHFRRQVSNGWLFWMGVLTYVIIFVIVLALAFGWGKNIWELTHMDCCAQIGLLILRVVGIFIPPLGGIVGYI